MGITLSTGARNAACNAIVDLLDVGSGAAGDFRFLDGASPIVIIDCQAKGSGAFGAASNGAAALAATPRSGVASGDSSSPGIDIFEARDADDAVVFSGTCSGTGGGGDIEFDNALVLTGQTVNLASFTLTQPAS